MCDLIWHTCVECGAEFKCDQRNSECPVFNGYDEHCYNCEYNEDGARQEEEAEARRVWEREEWERLYGHKG